MSDENKPKDALVPTEQSNIIDLDEQRIKRMKLRGNTMAMVEEFEILRLKLMYDKPLNQQEATKLVTYIKYFMVNGPTEPFRLNCKLLYERYVQPYGL